MRNYEAPGSAMDNGEEGLKLPPPTRISQASPVRRSPHYSLLSRWACLSHFYLMWPPLTFEILICVVAAVQEFGAGCKQGRDRVPFAMDGRDRDVTAIPAVK